MGLFKNTYNTIKVDTKPIYYGLKELSDTQFKIAQEDLKVKDRVEISLNEYKNLLKELEGAKNTLKIYENFVNDLGKQLKTDVNILLDSKLKSCEISFRPETNNYNLIAIWEVRNK